MGIALQKVCRDHLRIVARHGRQGRPCPRRITCGIYGGICHALQKLVQLEATALIALDSAGSEIEPIQVWNTPRCMNDAIGFECLLAVLGSRMNGEGGSSPLNGRYRMPGSDIDSGPLKACHEPAHQVGIELWKHSHTALQYRDLRARARGDM